MNIYLLFSKTICQALQKALLIFGLGLFTFVSQAQIIEVTINFPSVESVCRPGGQELLTINGEITALNGGGSIGSVSVDYFIDSNGNGTVEEFEAFVATFIAEGPVFFGQPFPFTHQFTVGVTQSCQLIARIDNTNVPNLANTVEVAVGVPRLVNAGERQFMCVNGTPTTEEFVLGDEACPDAPTYSYNWIAVPPATNDMLSSTSIKNPTATISHDGMTEDTLTFILSTTRPSCGAATFDEVQVIRSQDITISGNEPVAIEPGNSFLIEPVITGGAGAYTYNWSPAETLNGSMNPFPVATPTESTDYSVTVTDNRGCEATAVFPILVGLVEASVNFTDTLLCDGESIQIEAAGGTIYSWEESPFNASLGNLSSLSIANPIFSGGLPGSGYRYTLTVTNENLPGLSDVIDIIINVAPRPTIDWVSDIETCLGATLELNPQVFGGVAPNGYQFSWSENVGVDQQNLEVPIVTPTASTAYFLTVTDDNGCTANTGVNVMLTDTCFCDFFPDMDTLVVQTLCEEPASFCLDIPEDEFEDFTFSENGGAYDGPFARCNFDTVVVYSYFSLFGGGNAGLYLISEWEVNGTNMQAFFVSIPSFVDAMNDLDPEGNWTLDEATQTISGGAPGSTYGDMVIELTEQGIVSTLPVSQIFVAQGYSIELEVGAFDMVFVNQETGCTEEVFIEVACTKPETEVLEIDLGASQTICLPTAELVGEVASLENVCDSLSNLDAVIVQDTCVQITANSVGRDTLCMVLCDNFGICDTTFLQIQVIEFLPDEVIDVVVPTQQEIVCIDTSAVNLPGSIVSMTNVCPERSGTSVNFAVEESLFCLIYSGLEAGQDTACIEFCDDLNNCDTVNWVVFVQEGIAVEDTIVINQEIGAFCLDTNELPGTIESVQDLCPDDHGESVEFTIDEEELCVQYQGFALGTDTLCVLLTDDMGNLSLTNLVVTVKQLITDTIRVDVGFDPSLTVCIDTTELVEPASSITNICPENSGEQAEFFIDSDTYCVEIFGTATGIDTACIIVCDITNVCDTTILIAQVRESVDPPTARPDVGSTNDQTPLTLQVLGNDTIPIGFDTIFVATAPVYGNAMFNLDGSLSYVPDGSRCGVTDSLEYTVCNINGCATASVLIDISCAEVIIFTALSPNRDGINDVLTIQGIDDKPENRLRIYNRWGNEVFDSGSDGYQNDWQGTWDGQDLPDGTYYYIFEVLIEGKEEVFRGYIEIFR